jgi:predicted Zn-dependent protease
MLLSLLLLFLSALLVTAAQAANKSAAAHRAPASSSGGGAPYPQCRYANSKIVRWIPQEMPLRVYIAHGTSLDDAGADPSTGAPLNNTDNTGGWPDLVYSLIKSPDGLSKLHVADGYSEQMWQAVAQGINEWKRFQNEGLLSFELTDDPQDANVYIFWTNHFVGKTGMALFSNDIRGYTAKHLLPYATVSNALNSGNNALVENSLRPVVVQLATTETIAAAPVPISLSKLQASAAHEMGHVLGIDGHSLNRADLMSVYYGNGHISANDAATIRYIYHHNPDLIP